MSRVPAAVGKSIRNAVWNDERLHAVAGEQFFLNAKVDMVDGVDRASDPYGRGSGLSATLLADSFYDVGYYRSS